MPISTAPAIQKLQDCAKITTELKKSPAALLQLWIQNTIISRMPEFLQRQIAFDVFSRHTMVFSNVPGPSESVLFRGEKLLGMHVIFPNILPQVIIISYANNVFFTMTIDDEQFPDSAEMLPKFYLEELEEMAKGYGIVCTSNEMLSKPYE